MSHENNSNTRAYVEPTTQNKKLVEKIHFQSEAETCSSSRPSQRGQRSGLGSFPGPDADSASLTNQTPHLRERLF